MKKNLNISIISESLNLKLILQQKLESLGMMRVNTCSSVSDFLNASSKNFMEVVFLDSLVPDMTLDAAIDKILNTQIKTIILVVSSETLSQEIKKSLLYQGVGDFLLDKIEVQDLKNSLVRLL